MRTVLTTLTLFMFVFSMPVLGQITITSNTFMPSVGTVVTSKTAAIDSTFFASLIAGSGGPLQWDFTGQTYGGTTPATVVSLASTPSISTFPDANLVMQIMSGEDTVWSILRSVPTAFWELGSVTHSATTGDLVMAFQDSTPSYVFPISYGSQWDAHRLWIQGADPDIEMHIYDSSHYNVDAWGTAKYGSNEVPVLRVVQEERFTYLTYSGGVLISTTTADFTTVNFIGAGFDQAVSATRVKTQFAATSYNSVASGGFLGIPTGVREDESKSLPLTYDVEQNYPNPFNPQTEIRFSVPVRSDVRLAVYNLLGQEVKVLVDGQLGAGSYVADWDGTSATGQQVASGIYLYRISAGTYTSTKKMVLLK